MDRFKPVTILLISTIIFVLTIALLAMFGYEVNRDSPFEIDCKDAGGVYFISKSNEEYCANSDFVFNPNSVDTP